MFCINMSAKEIKALIEVGTSMGYSGEELKQFLTEERMRSDKERERQEKAHTPTHNQRLCSSAYGALQICFMIMIMIIKRNK